MTNMSERENMKLFFDTEFTGLHKNTTLISVGIIDEDGKDFYAEFNDYDKKQVSSWIQENVIKLLYFNKYNKDIKLVNDNSIKCSGSKKFIKNELLHWISKYDEIEFVSDVCHYDFVLLIDLLYGNALEIPYCVFPCCYDINQKISEYYKISLKDAFNMNREHILLENNIKLQENKHNSLYDAMVIERIYNLLK